LQPTGENKLCVIGSSGPFLLKVALGKGWQEKAERTEEKEN